MTLVEKDLVNYYEQIEELADIAFCCKSFSPELYKQYNVKRGLRNADGTGVLVGLTALGEVHGYIMDENEKVDVEGRLRYRGVNVQHLIDGIAEDNRFGFEETIFLLLFGQLPTKTQLDKFDKVIKKARMLPPGFVEDMILRVPSKNIMNKVATCVLGMFCYDDRADDISLDNVLRQSIELIARFPAIIAYCYHAKLHYIDGRSLHLHEQSENLSIAENFLRIVRSHKDFTDDEAKLLDKCLILHAEHGGGNNSSFIAHVVSSTGTDLYSAIAASTGALKGPRHGGANAAVMGMIDEIKANTDYKDEGAVSDYLIKIMKKEAYDKTGLVYGMGHAVYTLSDPRAIILKKNAEKLALNSEYEDEFRLYELVEKLTPKLFSEIKRSDKTISANVDLYSGFVYKMLGLDSALNTPIFAMARCVGWCAHVIEEVVSGGRIIRPAYKSISERQQYVKLSDR